MEKYIKIPTQDWFEIDWVLNWKEKNDKLIIFVHGLTWYGWEAHYVCGKDYFIEKWFDILRFNFYGWWKKNRTLQESSITSHALDLEDILEYFEQDYQEINFISHSLWCPSIIRMNRLSSVLKKIIFWDPAFDNQWIEKRFSQEGDKVIFTSWDGRFMEVSSQMYEERKQNHFEYLKSFIFSTSDIAIIFAGWNTKTVFKPQTDTMWIESYVIEWANHWFTQEWKYRELFDKTLEFIEK